MISINDDAPLSRKIYFTPIYPKRIRIALVSFKLSAQGLPNTYKRSITLKSIKVKKAKKCGKRESSDFIFWHIEEAGLQKVIDGYLYAIDKAKEYGAQIICFNEMSYPYNKDNDYINTEFKERLRKIAKNDNLYIIAGSFHDSLKTCHNTSYIFPPTSNPKISPIEQYKYTNAIALKEITLRPDHDHIEAVGTPYGAYLAVLICLDANDKEIWKKILTYLKEEKFKDIDYFVVPAFDPSSSIRSSSRKLSSQTGKYVFFVNVNLEIPENPTEVFFRGEVKSVVKKLVLSQDSLMPEIYFYDLFPERDLTRKS